jgi:hypothetical protein
MDTEAAAAFWSYTHKDDEGEDGRIVQLAHDVSAQYGMLTGGELTLFLDKDKLEWGDELRSRIDRALAETTFFIPFITPRYFLSEECRRELIAFSQGAKRLNVEALLLPIYFIDVPEMSGTDRPSDSAMQLVKEHKWEDWRQLCEEERSSAAYRKGVRRLAQRLVSVVIDLTRIEAAGEREMPGEADDDSAEDEAPGTIELLAQGEKALPEWNGIIEALSPEIDELGNLATRATDEIGRSDEQGGGATGRLNAAIRLAERLKPHAATILRLGQENAEVMVRVDPAINALIDAVEANPDEALQTEGIASYLDGIRGMARSGQHAVASLEQLSNSFDQSARLARVLRPPIRDVKTGLRGFMDAQAIFEAWDARLDALPIDLGDAKAPSGSSDAG